MLCTFRLKTVNLSLVDASESFKSAVSIYDERVIVFNSSSCSSALPIVCIKSFSVAPPKLSSILSSKEAKQKLHHDRSRVEMRDFPASDSVSVRNMQSTFLRQMDTGFSYPPFGPSGPPG